MSRPVLLSALCASLATLGTLARPAPAQSTCGSFPIADFTGPELSIDAAFDGTNFFVAMQGGMPAGFVGGRILSPGGVPIGLPRAASFFGGAPLVAYGGGQYLLVGSNDALFPNDDIFGQFFSTSGATGSAFPISNAAVAPEEIIAVEFDGANFLVLYQREVDVTSTESILYGRFVSPSGTVGAEIQISSGRGDHCLHGLAFDGTRYLAAWVDDVGDDDLFARFVSTAGVLSAPFLVHHSATVCDSGSVPVLFDGTNFLVVWSDDIGGFGTNTWDVSAQRVSTSGALLGGAIPVTTAPRGQMFPFATWDGTNYLVTWTDARNDLNSDDVCDLGEGTCWDVYGQYVSASGALVGSEFQIAADAGNQMTSSVISAGGRSLVVWTDGDWAAPSTNGIHGTFLNHDGCSPITTTCPGDGSGSSCPCGNSGVTGHGCANSIFGSGGRLIGSGVTRVSADSVTLTGFDMPSASALYFQGTTQLSGLPFGDGLRCVGGVVVRLGTKLNGASGGSFYPDPAVGDAPVSVRGLVPAAGGIRFYQGWYRNAAAFCTASTFNLTNAVRIDWVP